MQVDSKTFWTKKNRIFAALKSDNFSKSTINVKKSEGKRNDQRFEGVIAVPVILVV